MRKLNGRVTDANDFFRGNAPTELIRRFQSPLYVYSESILRERCREMKGLVDYSRFRVNYSAKANANVRLLEIIREEGLDADAMSPGEVFLEKKAGFDLKQILFVSNNMSPEEMGYVIENGLKISVDSLSQLETYGRMNPGGKAAVRINPGLGVGHHANVITGGKDTKFGVNMEYLPEIMDIAKRYNLTINGITIHLGSLFMDARPYIHAAGIILDFAKNFDKLDFVDFGGGFGIPYQKQEDERRLALKDLGEGLTPLVKDFIKGYGREIDIKIEPGRYIAAECGVLLGTVNAVKRNGLEKYAGTDLGFNVLVRPVMYNSHHDIEVYRDGDYESKGSELVTVVGNICETGDILARNRELPVITEGDVLGVLDAGAYGFSMSSNYNQRLRPAEVLIAEDGGVTLIRRRQTLEDLYY